MREKMGEGGGGFPVGRSSMVGERGVWRLWCRQRLHHCYHRPICGGVAVVKYIYIYDPGLWYSGMTWPSTRHEKGIPPIAVSQHWVGGRLMSSCGLEKGAERRDAPGSPRDKMGSINDWECGGTSGLCGCLVMVAWHQWVSVLHQTN
eukprot:TRINITY_DN7098_c0_g1_i1.p1 TRINITY_DN7098_c0_g1~~TRINITY_DN7098_c0_g1_i1.p1  ORF type:complete len:147 (+),score=9.14 TRINITY_DN7098_c0_g1_i1:159-599(+)